MYKLRHSITINKWVKSQNPLTLASKANLLVVCVCLFSLGRIATVCLLCVYTQLHGEVFPLSTSFPFVSLSLVLPVATLMHIHTRRHTHTGIPAAL